MPFVSSHTARDTRKGNRIIHQDIVHLYHQHARPRRRLNHRYRSPPRQYERPVVSLGDERRALPACVAQMATAIVFVAPVVEGALGHRERRLRPDVAEVAPGFCSLSQHKCLQVSCLSVV